MEIYVESELNGSVIKISDVSYISDLSVDEEAVDDFDSLCPRASFYISLSTGREVEFYLLNTDTDYQANLAKLKRDHEMLVTAFKHVNRPYTPSLKEDS